MYTSYCSKQIMRQSMQSTLLINIWNLFFNLLQRGTNSDLHKRWHLVARGRCDQLRRKCDHCPPAAWTTWEIILNGTLSCDPCWSMFLTYRYFISWPLDSIMVFSWNFIMVSSSKQTKAMRQMGSERSQTISVQQAIWQSTAVFQTDRAICYRYPTADNSYRVSYKWHVPRVRLALSMTCVRQRPNSFMIRNSWSAADLRDCSPSSASAIRQEHIASITSSVRKVYAGLTTHMYTLASKHTVAEQYWQGVPKNHQAFIGLWFLNREYSE